MSISTPMIKAGCAVRVFRYPGPSVSEMSRYSTLLAPQCSMGRSGLV